MAGTAATGAGEGIILAPKPPPISVGIARIWDSGMSRMAAQEERIAKEPWVQVQMVRRPSPAQVAVAAWGSM